MAYTTIDDPTQYFNTVLWTGNGGTQSITGVGFQPDWIWGKNRDDTNSHWFNDVVRGVDVRLIPHATGAEDNPGTDIVTSFDSDGFSLGSNTEGNKNTDKYVAWNWLAGGSASSNSDGDITSNVSANTTAGFSIVSYTGNGSNSTIGHGLGAVPKWIIVKVRDASNNWIVQHGSLGATKRLLLDGTQASASASTFFNNTDPTSSVFTVGTEDVTNNNGNTYIAYCFAEKKGYSKFGSYTGNGNADGTFVYTGFRPAWVMLKATSATGSWNIADSKRSPENEVDEQVQANLNNAESTSFDFDFTSNGFKARTTDAARNGSGVSYIYMAFAEAPFVNSNGVPCNAR